MKVPLKTRHTRQREVRNRANGHRTPLPARLFCASVAPVFVTPSNGQQHREVSGHAV